MHRSRIALSAAAAILLGFAPVGMAQDGDKPASSAGKDKQVKVVEGKDQSAGRIKAGAVRRGGEGRGDQERRGRGEEVAWADLPAPVLDAFSKVFVNANPPTATKFKIGRATTYEARENDSAEMVFARATEEGVILEVGRKAKSVPPAVQAFIDERLGGKVETVREVNMTFYEVEVVRGDKGRTQRMNLNAAGQPVPGAGLGQMMDRVPPPRNDGEKPVATPASTGKTPESPSDLPPRQTKERSGEKPQPRGNGNEKPKGPK